MAGDRVTKMLPDVFPIGSEPSLSSVRRRTIDLRWGLLPAGSIWATLYAAPVMLFAAYSLFRATMLSIDYTLTLDAYVRIFTDPIYPRVLVTTLAIAVSTACLVTVTAFIFSYYVTFHFRAKQGLILTLITISLFSGYLVRIYAWRTILGSEGILNSSFLALGLISHPLTFLLYSRFAVVVVLSCILLPFSIVPLFAALGNVPPELIEAARDLGASPIRAVRTVVMPIAHRGLMSAFTFAFVLACGDYVTPQLVGGTSTQMVGNVIADQFGASFDWPLASALGIVTTLCAIVVLCATSLVIKRVARP